MFLYTAVFAPVGEELICRGLVMPQFQRYGKVFAIVTSALLFGVMHANLFQMPFAFLTGLVLGYTAAEFSLRWSILLHLLNNLVFGELLGRAMGYLSPAAQDYLYRGINIFFFAFAAFWLLHRREQLKQYLRKTDAPENRRRFYGSGNAGVSHPKLGLAVSGVRSWDKVSHHTEQLHGAILFIAVQEKRCSCTHYFSMPSFKVWSDQLSSVVFTGYAPQYVPSTLRITVHFCCPDDAVYTSKSTVW
ncbi:MAG: lysostaphin resistance A-like protein [Ruminococcus sp.]